MDFQWIVNIAIDAGLKILPFCVGGLTALIGLRLMRKGKNQTEAARAAMGDGLLISTAIAEIQGDSAKETYLTVTVLMELERLTNVYISTDRIRFILGSIYLVTGFVSIAITGTNASIPNFADTVKLAFGVTIVGEIASGFLIFGSYEGKAASANQIASLIRLEISQFIGRSAEYYNTTPENRWFLMTQSIETLLLRSITPETDAHKKKSEESEADRKAKEKQN